MKSNDFTITVHDETTGEGKLSVGLKELVDLTVGGGGLSSSNESIKNNGGYMVFALRCKKITYKKGTLFLKERFSLDNPEDMKILAPIGSKIDFPSEDGLLELK